MIMRETVWKRSIQDSRGEKKKRWRRAEDGDVEKSSGGGMKIMWRRGEEENVEWNGMREEDEYRRR